MIDQNTYSFLFTRLYSFVILALFFPFTSRAQEDLVIASLPSSPLEVGKAVSFQVIAKDSFTQKREIGWDFGDGTSLDFSSGGEKVEHTFTTAGNFLVVAKVRDLNKEPTLSFKRLIVHDRLPAISPRSSGLMEVDFDNFYLWTANPDSNSVSKVSLQKRLLEEEIPVCRNPTSLTFASKNLLWVTCSKDDSVVIFDTITRKVIHSISLGWGSAPHAILSLRSSPRIYLTLEGSNELLSIDSQSLKVLSRVSLSQTPYTLAISRDEKRLAVSHLISLRNFGKVTQLDISSSSEPRVVPLMLDTTSLDTPNSARGIPNYLHALSYHPTNETLVVGGKKDNIVGGAYHSRGTTLNPETIVRSFIGFIESVAGKEEEEKRIDFDNRGLVSSLSWSSTGGLLFATLLTDDELMVIEPYRRSKHIFAPTGSAPLGVLINEKRKEVYTYNLIGRSISFFDVSQLITEGFGPLSLIGHVSVLTKEPLSTEVLTGKRLFYDATDNRISFNGYLACASCHLDGRDDGQVWDFTERGEGLRNTTALRGQGGHFGRLHWTGNFDEHQDFEHDMRKAMGGLGFLGDYDFAALSSISPIHGRMKGLSRELDALASFIDSLNSYPRSPFKNFDGTFTESGRRGAKVFEKLQCGSCHTLPYFSDTESALRHDVGTYKASSGKRLGRAFRGFDTPTLIGVFNTAPYLHDGSASTLDTLFQSESSGSIHFLSPRASKEESMHLIKFLQQLDEPMTPAIYKKLVDEQ
jgi:large repetitive protein